MAKSDKGLIARRSKLVEQEIDDRTDRLAKVLKPELTEGDSVPWSRAQLHDAIRRNWADPSPRDAFGGDNWRTGMAKNMGAVPLYKEALAAFGLPTHHQQTHDTAERQRQQLVNQPHLNAHMQDILRKLAALQEPQPGAPMAPPAPPAASTVPMVDQG